MLNGLVKCPSMVREQFGHSFIQIVEGTQEKWERPWNHQKWQIGEKYVKHSSCFMPETMVSLKTAICKWGI
jgi:hypothetical protein